ncbi:MAG: fatty acid desaturase [Bacteroidota bacterium]
MQRISATAYFSREERKALMQKNNWRAAGEILLHWLWIAVAFGLVWFWPNILTVLIALFILGGKQLACAILMHDAGHRAVFNHPKHNDLVGKWLGAYPIFQDLLRYRPYHNLHHTTTGLEEDPDLLLTRGYPTSSRSMMRKFSEILAGRLAFVQSPDWS